MCVPAGPLGGHGGGERGCPSRSPGGHRGGESGCPSRAPPGDGCPTPQSVKRLHRRTLFRPHSSGPERSRPGGSVPRLRGVTATPKEWQSQTRTRGSGSALWVHRGPQRFPTAAPGSGSAGAKGLGPAEPFLCAAIVGIPPSTRVPEGKRAERPPRAVMGGGEAQQRRGQDPILTPSPAEGQPSGLLLGKSTL